MNKLGLVGVSALILCTTGCSLLNPFVGDIGGWDLTACADRKGFKVCKELFLDNQEKILGGKKAIDLVLEQMKKWQVDDK